MWLLWKSLQISRQYDSGNWFLSFGNNIFRFLNFITYCMQHSYCWEENRFSAAQEIPHILWNMKLHYRIHKCLTPLPILSHSEAVFTPTSLTFSLIFSIQIKLGIPGALFLQGSPSKTLYIPLPSTIWVTCSIHSILLDFTKKKLLGKIYNTLSTSLYSFMHFSFTSSLLGPDILLHTVFSKHT